MASLALGSVAQRFAVACVGMGDLLELLEVLLGEEQGYVIVGHNLQQLHD